MVSAWILVSHAAVTWALVGLIWTIHVVHYPLFTAVESGFRQYHEEHLRRITLVVGPLMLAELAGAVYLWLYPPAGTDRRIWLVASGLVAVIWTVTALFSVPQHGRLETGGFDRDVHRALMISNWVRTLAWTARGLLIAWVLVRWASALQLGVSRP